MRAHPEGLAPQASRAESEATTFKSLAAFFGGASMCQILYLIGTLAMSY